MSPTLFFAFVLQCAQGQIDWKGDNTQMDFVYDFERPGYVDPQMDNVEGYECDRAVTRCAQSCDPYLDVNLPDLTQCSTWKCAMRCAKIAEDYPRCYAPWVGLCKDIAKDEIHGAGPDCDVDCSAAVPLAVPGIVVWLLLAVFWRAQ